MRCIREYRRSPVVPVSGSIAFSIARIVAFLATLAVSLGWATEALADTDACIADYDAGVAAKKAGKTREARTRYAACAIDACPAEVRAECQRGVDVSAKAIPALVFAVRGEAGDVTRGQVFIDGVEAEGALEGLPVEVDPGERHVRLVLADGRELTLTIVARLGEKNRLVRLDAPAKQRKKLPERRSAPRSILGPVLIGTGAVALGSFGVFGLLGRSKENELEKCAPRCAPDEISKMQRLYLVADISLAVSVLALGSGTYLLLQPGPKESAGASVVGRF